MHRNELNYEISFSHWEKMVPVMGKVDMEENKTKKTRRLFFLHVILTNPKQLRDVLWGGIWCLAGEACLVCSRGRHCTKITECGQIPYIWKLMSALIQLVKYKSQWLLSCGSKWNNEISLSETEKEIYI